MTGVNIPPSIFAGAGAQPFNAAPAQPASVSGDAWKLQGLPSWQDRLTPAMDWQPESTMPLSEASFGLSSIQSRQSLGEKVSLASKQMALSVLDILAAKPPGPPSPSDDPGRDPTEQPDPGQPSSSTIPEASPLTGLDRELSVRNLPEQTHLQSPRLDGPSGPSADPPAPLNLALVDMGGPSGAALPPSQYPLFTQRPNPVASAFRAPAEEEEQSPSSSPSAPLRAHSLDPALVRLTRSTRAGSSGGAAYLDGGGGRRSTRAASAVLPAAAPPPVKLEFKPGATPQTSGSMGTEMTLGAELPATTGGASSRPQRRGSGGRGSGDRRKSSKKDDLRSKNREAQRRFREKQKAKLDQLEEKNAEVEEYKRCLERLQRDYEERLQGTATELRRLQLEKTMLQVRESRLVDMVGQLERARAAGVSPAERAQCLDSITAEAGRVRSGRAADSAAAVLAKVAEYIKVEDFDGAESAAALAGPEGAARTEALRLVSYMLQANRSQEGTIVTVKDIINLPRESFLTLYASAAKELVGLLGQCPQAEPTLEDPHGAFITPAELRIQRLVREARALMCCFAATDAREACRQQLRHVDDWSPVDQDTNRRLTCSVLRAMRLTAVQEAALREAHGQFVARQQSLAQQRSRALPHLQATLYTSGRTSVDDSLGAHEAAALVIHTTEEECDNICRLSTHFLSRVLTDWQAALLFAKSHPYSPHIMGIIETAVSGAVEEEPELDRQGTGVSMDGAMDEELSS